MAQRRTPGGYFIDSVGRPRKLTHGAMVDICLQFANGALVSDLAKQYQVSASLIRTVTYNTARQSDLARLYVARNSEEETS